MPVPELMIKCVILFAAGRGEALKRFLVEEGLDAISDSGVWPRPFLPFIP